MLGVGYKARCELDEPLSTALSGHIPSVLSGLGQRAHQVVAVGVSDETLKHVDWF